MRVDFTARLAQLEGKYDLSPQAELSQAWDVDLTLPEGWSVAAIVGESGSGKTTIARELAKALGGIMVEGRDADGRPVDPFKWPADKCILDGFPASLGKDEIFGMLTGVGFGSVPHWRLPFRCLSQGQQFRVNLARAILEARQQNKPVVIDEYASLVDPTAARVGSIAVGKAVRRMGLKLVVVTWREDVLAPLECDAVMRVQSQSSDMRAEARTPICFENTRGLLRRPGWSLRIVPVRRSAWARFAAHHYLSHELHHDARCYVGLLKFEDAGADEAAVEAAFTAVLHFPSRDGLTYREHRTVCKPQYQGIGVGTAMSDALAACFASTGRPYYSLTGHPAMIAHRMNRPGVWECVRKFGRATDPQRGLIAQDGRARQSSAMRATASFRYVGAADHTGARKLAVPAVI